MRKFDWLVLGSLLIYLVSCTNTQKINSPSITTESKTATLVSTSASPILLTGGNEGGLNLNIPDQNEPAPQGILQQLAWSGLGGGPDDQKCGKCSVEINEVSIALKDFLPNQQLKLHIYRHSINDKCDNATAEHVTTKFVQVDENGNLLISLSGQTTGLAIPRIEDLNTNQEVWRDWEIGYDNLKCIPPTSCPNAPPQRLTYQSVAVVCTSKDSVKLREGPGKGFPILKSLVPGAEVTVISGPRCSNNWSWWKVKTESGYEGWMSEGGDETDTYFLCPKK